MVKLSIFLAVAGFALLAASVLVQPAATPQPMPTVRAANANTGRALFLAKGCASCHHHASISGSGPLGGFDIPDLSAPRSDAVFLRRWLTNPTAVRPGTAMPTLNLREDEITALIAFLSQGQP